MERVCRQMGVGLLVFVMVGLWGKTALPQEDRKPAGLEFTQEMTVKKTIEDASPIQASDDASKLKEHFRGSEIRKKGVQEIALIASDLGFFPKTFFVNPDVPVRLYVTGASKNSLCILMDSFQVRKQLRSQRIEEISFTPEQPGRFRFYCPINGMEGMMVVREPGVERSMASQVEK